MSAPSRPILLLLCGLLFATVSFSALSTQVPLWLTRHALPVWQIGIVGSSYFIGNLVGTLLAGWLINLFGFKKSYHYACAIFAVATIGLGFSIDFIMWLGWRFLAGIACAIIWVTVESSLLRAGTIDTRSKLLAAYMLVYYLGSVLGQLILQYLPTTLMYFILSITTFMFIAMLPLLFTRLQKPVIHEQKPEIWPMVKRQEARLGVIGCIVSGIMLGSIYGLLPVYLAHEGMDNNIIANRMALLITAGIVAQLPVGWLADRYGRLLILRLQSTIVCIASLLLMLNVAPTLSLFILGAAGFTQYPISMAWACERVTADELVAMNQALLLSYTVGSLLGPSIVAVLMERYANNLLFVAISSVALAYAMMLFSRMSRQHKPILSL